MLIIAIFRMCPIFQVSNVTGENLELLKRFMNLLSTRLPYNLSAPAEFQIDDTFSVPVSNSFFATSIFHLNITKSKHSI